MFLDKVKKQLKQKIVTEQSPVPVTVIKDTSRRPTSARHVDNTLQALRVVIDICHKSDRQPNGDALLKGYVFMEAATPCSTVIHSFGDTHIFNFSRPAGPSYICCIKTLVLI